MVSTDTALGFFFLLLNIFDLPLVEPMSVEPVVVKGQIPASLHPGQMWLLSLSVSREYPMALIYINFE